MLICINVLRCSSTAAFTTIAPHQSPGLLRFPHANQRSWPRSWTGSALTHTTPRTSPTLFNKANQYKLSYLREKKTASKMLKKLPRGNLVKPTYAFNFILKLDKSLKVKRFLMNPKWNCFTSHFCNLGLYNLYQYFLKTGKLLQISRFLENLTEFVDSQKNWLICKNFIGS